VSCYVECCISGILRHVNVVVWNCGGEECGICSALCDCCVMSDVENAMCCDVRCGGVMRCGIWCGVKYAMMLNVGVVWNSCVYGMV